MAKQYWIVNRCENIKMVHTYFNFFLEIIFGVTPESSRQSTIFLYNINTKYIV